MDEGRTAVGVKWEHVLKLAKLANMGDMSTKETLDWVIEMGLLHVKFVLTKGDQR